MNTLNKLSLLALITILLSSATNIYAQQNSLDDDIMEIVENLYPEQSNDEQSKYALNYYNNIHSTVLLMEGAYLNFKDDLTFLFTEKTAAEMQTSWNNLNVKIQTLQLICQALEGTIDDPFLVEAALSYASVIKQEVLDKTRNYVQSAYGYYQGTATQFEFVQYQEEAASANKSAKITSAALGLLVAQSEFEEMYSLLD